MTYSPYLFMIASWQFSKWLPMGYFSKADIAEAFTILGKAYGDGV
jgi:hypothetical protein